MKEMGDLGWECETHRRICAALTATQVLYELVVVNSQKAKL